jgi:polar amino acid transport system permease protein
VFFQGLGNTVKVAVIGLIIGIVIGTLIAVIKVAPKYKLIYKILDKICSFYTLIFRGTPIVAQLLIAYYVIIPSLNVNLNALSVGMIVFGMNSGAYVSENIRAGIMSVDKGQTEAGRALGLSGTRTMIGIVIPQGIKNVIPAIGNELIALLKETSIISMIGMFDLTQAAKVIGSGQNLASFVAPMFVVALFYLAIVYLLTLGIAVIERRLRSSDKR